MQKTLLKEILINYHLNEVCNFNCRYCFSKWDISKKAKSEQSIDERILVLQELKRYFDANNRANPLTKQLHWEKARINFSGGEPLLIKKIDSLIIKASELGFRPSIVTNGSLLNEMLLKRIAPHLVKLGLSLDSPYINTLKTIGRMTKSGKSYSENGILESIKQARQFNPNIIIKINTIVSAFNKAEDFSPLIDKIQPDEWSVIQVLDFFDKPSAVTNSEFQGFVDFHRKKYPHLLFSEDNEDYIASFLMVGPENNFFSNQDQYTGGKYKHSDAIHKVGAHKALSQIDFDYQKFIKRHMGKKMLYTA
jgi:radical S-adenosyl methionine domain-containing protein 2